MDAEGATAAVDAGHAADAAVLEAVSRNSSGIRLQERGPDDGPSSRGAPDLTALAGRVRPLVPASDLVLPVPGDLGRLLPGGGLRWGTAVSVVGAPGAGRTSVALSLAAAVTGVGEWVAWVGDDSLGAVAAAEAGVVPERLSVVRDVPRDRWDAVVAALVDGVAMVVVEPASRVRPATARRLAARLRQRQAVLVALGEWPDRVSLELSVERSSWDFADGLGERRLDVTADHRGRPVRQPVVLGA